MTDDDLSFTRHPPGPVPEPLEPPSKRYQRANRVATHILLWRDETRLRWCVAAGDKRGEILDEPERYVQRSEADRAAGRMAKRTGALVLLVSAYGTIEKYDYKPAR